MEFALSILFMVAVVGTLAGWAFREDRRRRRAETTQAVKGGGSCQ